MINNRVNIYMLFLFLYLFFLSFFNYTPFYLISGLLLTIFSILRIFKSKKLRLTSYFYFEIIFIIYNFFYVLFNLSINSVDTLNALKTLCLNLFINIGVMNCIENNNDIKKVLKWIMPIAFFACIFIIIYSKGSGIDGRLAHGVPRLFSSSNYTSMEVASWAMYASAISIFFYLDTKNKKYLLGFPLYTLVVLWSGSRKCFAIFIFLSLLTYLSAKKTVSLKKIISKYFKIFILFLIIVISIFKVPLLYNVVGYRFEGYFNNTELSAVSRSKMKNIAIEYIVDKPFVGYGLDTFRDISIYKTWSECNYLELAFSGGIQLAIYYYLYLFYLIYYLFKNRKRESMFRLLYIIIFSIVIFDYISMSYIGRLESFFITLASVLVFIDKRNRRLGLSYEK